MTGPTVSASTRSAKVASKGAIDAESGLGDPCVDALGNGIGADALACAGEVRLPLAVDTLAEAEASRNEGEGAGPGTEESGPELEGTLTDG